MTDFVIKNFDYAGYRNKKVVYSRKSDMAIILSGDISNEDIIRYSDQIFKHQKSRNIKAIFFKKIVFEHANFEFLKPFYFMLSKIYIVVLFALFLILTCTKVINLYSNYTFFYNETLLKSNWIIVIIFFTMLFIQTLIHELGHIMAMKKNGLRTKGIGIGIYITSIVLFVPMYEAWTLGRKKRFEIDIAGIIFQLTFIIGCSIANYWVQSYIVDMYIVLSVVIVMNNFNPFLKYDGYWMFSDILGVYNLHGWMGKIIRNFKGYCREIIVVYPKKTSIMITTYLVVSLAYIFFLLIALLLINIKNIELLISNVNIFTILYSIIFVYLTYLTVNSFKKIYFNKE